MKYPKYTVGDRVLVTAVVKRVICEQNSDQIELKRSVFEFPKFGKITGYSYRYPGRKEFPSRDFDGEYDGGVEFRAGKPKPVWLVRFGLRNKEVAVFEEDLSKYVEPNKSEPTRGIPFVDFPRRTHKEQSLFRQTMREEMMYWPRGKDGRWLKFPYRTAKSVGPDHLTPTIK